MSYPKQLPFQEHFLKSEQTSIIQTDRNLKSARKISWHIDSDLKACARIKRLKVSKAQDLKTKPPPNSLAGLRRSFAPLCQMDHNYGLNINIQCP